jgi:ABC-type dipeptide/oligopeptide/nickel transport system, ATPase component
MTSLAVMGLLPEGGPWVRTGRAELAGFDVIHSPPYRRVETGHGGIAMIFQEPMSSLNPVMRIGEADRGSDPGSRKAFRRRADPKGPGAS